MGMAKKIAIMFMMLIGLAMIVLLWSWCIYEIEWEELCKKSENIKIGATREELIAVMGEPTHQTHSEDGNALARFALLYTVPRHLAQQLSLSGISPQLTVQFENRKVVSYELVPYRQITFESVDWKRSSPERRGCMIDDLLSSNNIHLMNKNAVVALLGDPDDTFPLYRPGWEYEYNLGAQREIYPIIGRCGYGLALDDDHLLIKFDTFGIVCEIAIEND